MDEKVTAEIQEIEFHQHTVDSDEHSPLHLIREKEMEISGRVLAAKREADEIVAEARKDATKMLAAAHEQATQEAVGIEGKVAQDLERDAEQSRADADKEAAELSSAIDARRPEAVRFIIDAVTSV